MNRPLHLCPVGIIQKMFGSGTVQETLARHALHAKNPFWFGYFTGFLLSRLCKNPIFVFPNPPCPPYQRGIRVTSPPDKGDLGGWVFRQRNLARVSCTVSFAGTTNIGLLYGFFCTAEAALPAIIPAVHKCKTLSLIDLSLFDSFSCLPR